MIFFVALSSGIYLNNAHSPTDILRVHLRKVKQRTHDVCHVQKTAKGRLGTIQRKLMGWGHTGALSIPLWSASVGPQQHPLASCPHWWGS